jgi:hypothetical protein
MPDALDASPAAPPPTTASAAALMAMDFMDFMALPVVRMDVRGCSPQLYADTCTGHIVPQCVGPKLLCINRYQPVRKL